MIIRNMNIQVENPISVLNQHQSREFLKNATARKLYELFMKATQLELISENYRASIKASTEAEALLNETSEQLKADMKDIKALEQNIKLIDRLGDVQTKLMNLEIELHWSKAIGEEEKLILGEDILVRRVQALEILQSTNQDHGVQVQQIINEIESFTEEIETLENYLKEAEDNHTQARNQSAAKKEEINRKVRDRKTVQKQLRDWQRDVDDLTCAIDELEHGKSDAERIRIENKERLAKMQKELGAVEAMLRTKQIEVSHMETDKFHLESEMRVMNPKLENDLNKVQRMKYQLDDLKQQSGDALTVFGKDVPRLLKRIDEECAKGRFKKKPCGPMGRYIKMKDETWTPVIEAHLGQGFLAGYCVDNAQDAKTLGNLMKQVFFDDHSPNIMCSKFHDRVHNVSARTSSTVDYPCLLDVMEISNPIVANCIIDQREPECIQLIPTSAEAKNIMGNVQFVPRNCKRALTLKGDTFYPDPHYRFYGGKVATRAKWLQVSTTEAIQTLQEEITAIENENNLLRKKYQVLREKLKQNSGDYNNLQSEIKQLGIAANRLKSTIEQINDNIIEETNDNCDVLKSDKLEKLSKIEIGRQKEIEIQEEITLLSQEHQDLENQVISCQEVYQDYYRKIDEKKSNIRDLTNQQRQVELNARDSKLQIRAAIDEVNQAKAHVNELKENTAILVAQAEALGSRIETDRSVSQISRNINALKVEVQTVETTIGSREELLQKLTEKRNKTNQVFDFKVALTQVVEQHVLRVDVRRREYSKMKRFMAHKVRCAFSNVLALRNYTGAIDINHASKHLSIGVTPSNTETSTVTDLQTLSGGERSYSTMAFVLALWECTTSPFYFLDEFDVFMDIVNRRVIMDILLTYSKEHPERQFGFLTPVDISDITADDCLSIHQ